MLVTQTGSIVQENLISVANINAGGIYVQPWQDINTLRLAATGLSVYADQLLEARLEISDNQSRVTKTLTLFLHPAFQSGNQSDYNVVHTPMVSIPARYYRWVVYNRGTAATTSLRIAEMVANSPLSQRNVCTSYLLDPTNIRDINAVNLRANVLAALGDAPKTILIKNSLDQPATITFKTARFPNFDATIGTYTIAAASQAVLTYADYPILSGPIHELYGTASCATAPTTGSLRVALLI